MTNPPPSWTPSKVKYLGRYINGYAFKPGDWSDSDIGKPIIRIQNLTDSEAPLNYYEGTLHDDLLVKTGDLLISWSASLGAYEWRKEDAWLNQHIFKVDLNSKIIEKRYFKWLAIHFMGDLSDHAHGSTMQHLTKDRFGKFPVTLPPIPEQLDIADYLDRETARIDELVAAKESMLQLLEEKRAALISRAVTRGLDPKAPTKPSGLDWLGDIPAHWEIRRLKFVAMLRSGNSITSELIEPEGSFPVYGGNGLRGHTENYTHEGDYVLIGRQGALCGNINYVGGKFFASEHAVVANPVCEYEVIWLGELLRMMNLNQYSESAAQPGLAVEKVANLRIPVPPFAEQCAIVAHLEAEKQRSAKLESALRESIALLKERRSALITAAVTGQIPLEEMSA